MYINVLINILQRTTGYIANTKNSLKSESCMKKKNCFIQPSSSNDLNICCHMVYIYFILYQMILIIFLYANTKCYVCIKYDVSFEK